MNSSGKAENINKDIQRHSKLCCTYICLQYLLYGGFLYRKPYIFHVKELSLKAIYVWLFRAGDYTALTGFSRLSLSLRQVGQLYAALSFMAKLSSSAPQGMGRGNCKTVKNWNWHLEKYRLFLLLCWTNKQGERLIPCRLSAGRLCGMNHSPHLFV